jgi:hypothetical protein
MSQIRTRETERSRLSADARRDDFDCLWQMAASVDERRDPVAEPEMPASARMTAGKTPRWRQQARAVEPVLLDAAKTAADRFKIGPEPPVLRVDAGERSLSCTTRCRQRHHSGAACATAPITRSAARWQVLVRPLMAAGCMPFITVPSGAATVIGRARPEFGRIFGSTTALSAY